MGMVMRKVVPMWQIKDFLWTENPLKEAESDLAKDLPKCVFVGIPEDTVLTRHGYHKSKFNNWLYDNQEEAEEQVDLANWGAYVYEAPNYYFSKFHFDIDIETPDGLLTVTEAESMSVEQFKQWCMDYIRTDQEQRTSGMSYSKAMAFWATPQKVRVGEAVARAMFAAYEAHGRDEAFRLHLADSTRWANETEALSGIDKVLFAKILYAGIEIEGEDDKG